MGSTPKEGIDVVRIARQSGITLIEVAIVTVVIGILAGVSFSGLRQWQQNERASASARSAADLLRLAASDALRTGNVQIVFLSVGGSGDTAGNALVDANGNWTPMIVLDDGAPGSAGQNCVIDPGEAITALAAREGVGWGNTLTGGAKAPGDATAIASTTGSSFATPSGTATTWVAFMPDGRPLGFDNACAFGQLGSGTGGIYLTNGKRDFAVVLNPLGGVRVHAWNAGAGAWEG